MIKLSLQLKKISLLSLVCLLSTVPSAMAVNAPDPVSGGKFFEGRGTKAAEDYEGRAGGPVYEYGKGLQFGALHLIPQIAYNRVWENNVFYDENGRRDDWINRLDVGGNAELPFGGGQHLFAASYFNSNQWFETFDAQDYTGHVFGAGVELNYVPFSVSVDDHFRRTVDRSGTEFTTRVSREENTFHTLLEIPFSAFFLESEIFDLNEDFASAEDSRFDRNDFDFYQRAGFDVFANHQLLAEYNYKVISYGNVDDRDGNANQLMLGLRGNWTERISYQAWGGAQFRIYDEDIRPDFHGFVARGAVQYSISDVSSITLKGDRTPQESTFDDQSFYVRNRGELAWRQQIAERLFFLTRETLQYNTYSRRSLRAGEDRTRKDWVWQTGVGLEYFLPNNLTSFNLEYKFTGRESNTVNFDYDAQSFQVGVKQSF